MCRLAFLCILSCSVFSFAQSQPVDRLSTELRGKIDTAAQQVLSVTGVPSASVAIVQNGEIVYTHAYGKARLQPPTEATPQMRYSIGSISKQFTATAILLLEQQGKLSVDDKVSKYLPDLTRADEVTLRMLLAHTSGYQDYWPEDYLMTPMLQPATAQQIMDKWGKKPLDFDPGTRWQYSNTNYVIAGAIVEKVSGSELFRFLQQNVFAPLKMSSVYNSDIESLGKTDAEGYIRYALGPLRPAPPAGNGWMFAAGELAMPVYDLALWDISVMNQSLLAPKSYAEMNDSFKLKDGDDTHYGLGVFVARRMDRPAIEHSGEVSGFVAENVVFPDDKAAIVVLTNQDATSAASLIARQVAPLILSPEPKHAAASPEETQALAIFTGLQQGKLDRSLFTQWCNDYFNNQAIQDFESSLKPLGAPVTFNMSAEELRGGMTFRSFTLTFKDPKQKLRVTTYTMPDGKLEQYLVIPVL
ncbi:beta-lactamase [Candidatus Koribacter versatilis Ellin345]|uniref:Beta-lactamase n=1 Tax=Koribacter versatilis (strain Ellin345) TaxID=204669 RepID=Q1IN32_KORVE|nr:serine hydrolase domain-containing protein [Candidatus Koribacter versatilis]ABF41718.1 beta-lactamase [Candidatus Koribacter versatilis Ellin345]